MADVINSQGNDEPQSPLWIAPTISFPKPNSTVSPGFTIQAGELLAPADAEWRVHIMQGDKLVKELFYFGFIMTLTVPYGILP